MSYFSKEFLTWLDTNADLIDQESGPIADQLLEIDNLLNDFNRSMADYQESLTFDEEEYARIRDRLDLINHLKGKYGQTVEAVLQELEENKKRPRLVATTRNKAIPRPIKVFLPNFFFLTKTICCE